MIKKDELLKAAKINGMKPYQQEKHYIQTIILRSIYSRFNPAFKGGTALMFVYGLNRFSEDLDFTTSGDFTGSELLKTVIADCEYMGIRTKSKIVSDNDITFSFKIGAEGPLFTREIERCFVSVEISRREKIEITPRAVFIETIYPDVLPFTISVMDAKEIAAEKIRAILTRNSARDVYDLWFLAKKGTFTDINLVGRKLSYYGKTFDSESMKNRIEAKKDIWTSELTPILIGPTPDFGEVERSILNAIRKSVNSHESQSL